MGKLISNLILLVIISCSTKEIFIEEIPFSYENNNAQPTLVSSNGSLSLTWISTKENYATLNFSQYKNGKWIKPLTISNGSDWFVNWADFPAHAVNEDLIITSHLKKSATGTYTYDVILNLQNLSGEKLKKDFKLNTDGIKAEHGFVSIVPNDMKGFFITWLDGRNTVQKNSDGDHKPMTIRFAEITNKGDIINESELDAKVCDCCQTSITDTKSGPIVVYRDRGNSEVRDIYSIKRKNGIWEDPSPVHNDGWVINGCPVNGPKVIGNSKSLAVAWFTAPNGDPKVNLSFSKINNGSFNNPLKINDHSAIGRVDVAFLNDEEVIVSYMEVDNIGTYLRLKKVSVNGEVSKPITISKIDGGRNTGVPQLEIINNEIFIVWTIFNDGMNQLKSVKLSSKSI